MEYDYHKPKYTMVIMLDTGTEIRGYFYPFHIKQDTVPDNYTQHYIYHQRNMSYRPLWITHKYPDSYSIFNNDRFYGTLLIDEIHDPKIDPVLRVWKIENWYFGLADIISRPANYIMTEVGVCPNVRVR